MFDERKALTLMNFQFKAVGIYLRLGRKLADRTTTHGTESRVPSDQLHAPESKQRPSYHRSTSVVFGTHQTPGHLSER